MELLVNGAFGECDGPGIRLGRVSILGGARGRFRVLWRSHSRSGGLTDLLYSRIGGRVSDWSPTKPWAFCGASARATQEPRRMGRGTSRTPRETKHTQDCQAGRCRPRHHRRARLLLRTIVIPAHCPTVFPKGNCANYAAYQERTK